MHRITLRTAACTGCGRCAEICRRGVLKLDDDGTHRIATVADPTACRSCGACSRACPAHAIEVGERNGRRTAASVTRAALQLILPAALGLPWLSECSWSAIDGWRLVGLFVLCHLLLFHLPVHRFTRKNNAR